VPMLRALRRIIEKADAHKVPVSLCGEMGGQPLEALALLAVGFRSLSMSPANIGPVKAMILAADAAAVADFVTSLLDVPAESLSLRGALHKFAETHHIPV